MLFDVNLLNIFIVYVSSTIINECKHWQNNYLLDNSSTRYRMTVRPQKNHISTVNRSLKMNKRRNMVPLISELSLHKFNPIEKHSTKQIESYFLNKTTSSSSPSSTPLSPPEQNINIHPQTDHHQTYVQKKIPIYSHLWKFHLSGTQCTLIWFTSNFGKWQHFTT